VTTAKRAHIHPDSHRPHFYELDGSEHVYYIFRYPAGQKVLLMAVWQRVEAAM